MKRTKHTPLRTCVVCRNRGDKRTFTRLVRTDQGVLVDPSGKLNGRGAYVCSDPRCWDRAVNTTILNKALKTALTDDERRTLQEAMPNHDTQ